MKTIGARFIELVDEMTLLMNLFRTADGPIPIPAQDADHVYRIMRSEWHTDEWKETA